MEKQWTCMFPNGKELKYYGEEHGDTIISCLDSKYVGCHLKDIHELRVAQNGILSHYERERAPRRPDGTAFMYYVALKQFTYSTVYNYICVAQKSQIDPRQFITDMYGLVKFCNPPLPSQEVNDLKRRNAELEERCNTMEKSSWEKIHAMIDRDDEIHALNKHVSELESQLKSQRESQLKSQQENKQREIDELNLTLKITKNTLVEFHAKYAPLEAAEIPPNKIALFAKIEEKSKKRRRIANVALDSQACYARSYRARTHDKKDKAYELDMEILNLHRQLFC